MHSNPDGEVQPGMQVMVRAVSGPAAGTQAGVGMGETLTVGRGEDNSLPIPQDEFLSGAHFAVTRAGAELRVKDLGSRNGTRVNGVAIQECVLRESDEVQAGNSRFVVSLGGEQLLPQAEFLAAQREPLYAVLDAARDKAILPLLEGSGEPFFSLYFGQSVNDLKTVAPYLVPLPRGSKLLNRIVAEGWTHSWGIFLTCGEPVAEVWKQLRRSLMVTLQGTQEQVYFRFYDPRVFRVFFRVSTPQQRMEFSGPIRNFFAEDEDASVVLQFSPGVGAVTAHAVAVAGRHDTAMDPERVQTAAQLSSTAPRTTYSGTER